MMDKSGSTSVLCSNGVKICSIFNSADYGNIINNKSGIKISKLMKLNFGNAASNVDTTSIKTDGVRKSSSEGKGGSSESGFPVTTQLNVPDVRSCSFCNAVFSTQFEQRQHYKLDWHRYNIKLNIKQKQYVTETQFVDLMDSVNDNDDLSSISGSESESSDDEVSELEGSLANERKSNGGDNSVIPSVGNKIKLILENDKGNIITLYRCLFNKFNNDGSGSSLATESQYMEVVNKLPGVLVKSKWLVLMLGGGHFAAAVFHGAEPVLHKTFHSYTVRAKQGGSQSSKDNKRATNAKSAGASLRRYNEQSQLQHIQDILSCWSKEVAECELLLYRAVGPANRSILFGGRQPPLLKGDPRLCSIPFPTRRATHNEVKRVHTLLSSIYVYESKEVFSNLFQLHRQPGDISQSNPIKKKRDQIKTKRASKQRQSPTRDACDAEIDDLVNRIKLESSSEGEEEYELVCSEKTISFSETLEEFCTPTSPLNAKQCTGNTEGHENENMGVKRKKKKRNKIENLKSDGISGGITGKLAKQIHLGCVEGNIELLKSTLTNYQDSKKCSRTNSEQVAENVDVEVARSDVEKSSDSSKVDESITAVFNQSTQDGLTLLQNAAKNSQKEIVRFLLENGADLCARDKKSMTAYDFAPDKDTRNVFRRFMGEFPDLYDYSKSHIPSPLNDEIEKDMADKKRALKRAKRQKEKEKKLADMPRREEEAEKKRYLDLSDREKRALAAERRILKAVGKAAETLALVRCYRCALNITGKVPFEYNNFVFCSIECLKAHRKVINKV